MSTLDKPDWIFDRTTEWRQLTAFTSAMSESARLGIVSGRRRQGKTFLVEALARQTGGLYFSATEATASESLRLFGQAVTDHLDAPTPVRYADWDEAIRHLFSVVGRAGRPVVIDEFPHLSRAGRPCRRSCSGRSTVGWPNGRGARCCCAVPPCPSWADYWSGRHHCAAGQGWN